jgi:hypothetical protein
VPRCNIESTLSKNKYHHHYLQNTLQVLALLLMVTTIGTAAENAEQKPKKTRFELASSFLQDNKSGLMWTVNANIAERTFSWEGAQDYLVKMNRDRYAGYRDWRMPTRAELETLIGHVKSMGFDGTAPERAVAAGLQKIGIQNVQPNSYWSSTSSMYNSAEAWQINMVNGACAAYDKALYLFLWPVRSLK